MVKVDDNFIIETNRKCYDALGELYTDGMDDLEKVIAIGIWQEFLDSLSGKKVLDVGCGAGDVVQWLVEHDYSVTACDLSSAMTELVKEKVPQAKVINCSATELNQLGEQCFDGMTAVHLVQHLSKTMLKQFFNQVYDLLNDNGKFLLVWTNTCYEKTGYQLDGELEGNYIFWHKWRVEDIVPLLAQAKLKPIAMRLQKTTQNGCELNAEPFAFICEKVK